MKKTPIILVGGLIILLAGSVYFFNRQKSDQPQEQVVLEQTLTISQKYSILRYRTENVLNTKNYPEYDAWNNEMTDIIGQWKTLEDSALALEKSATKMAEEKTSFNLISQALAYTTEEVTNIINKAPMGKQVRTLAQHLGVDAKMAQLILNQTQDQISREAYGGEGDVFEKCEQNSMRIKNGAKVTVFVGGVVLTGGMSAVATSGVVAKTALVVGGADLVLEVADDEAKIALGDKNKVSEMVGKMRTVTEPAASILAIVNMPGNVSKAMEKISAISFVGDQIRSVAQDEKILGINIKTDDQGEVKAQVSGLTEQELSEWRNENNVVKSGESVEEILNQIEKEIKEEAKDIKEVDNDLTSKTDTEKESTNIEGFGWKGTLSSVSGGNNEKQNTDLDFVLNKDGTVNGGNFKWKQEGNSIKLFGEDEKSGYYEFIVSENSLTLSKMVIGDEEIMPGQEYMGGIAPSGVLYKKTESKSEDSKKGTISFSEWDAWGDADSRYKEDLIDKFGNPDITETKGGKQMWVYHDLVYYESGATCSPMYTFYDTDQTATRKCETRENVESIINYY